MADQKPPHFIPRTQGTALQDYNNLQGWFCPFKCSVILSACGTPRDAGHSQLWQQQRGCRTHPGMAVPPGWCSTASLATPVAGRASPANPVKWQQENKAVPASLGTVHGLL